MTETVVHERHYITHDDHPEVAIPVDVDVIYRVLDDGFALMLIVPESIDYVCVGSA